VRMLGIYYVTYYQQMKEYDSRLSQSYMVQKESLFHLCHASTTMLRTVFDFDKDFDENFTAAKWFEYVIFDIGLCS
jgi:hypothetical protein